MDFSFFSGLTEITPKINLTEKKNIVEAPERMNHSQVSTLNSGFCLNYWDCKFHKLKCVHSLKGSLILYIIELNSKWSILLIQVQFIFALFPLNILIIFKSKCYRNILLRQKHPLTTGAMENLQCLLIRIVLVNNVF